MQMRTSFLAILMLLVSCSSGSSAADAESSIRAALAVLSAGIEGEDAVLASQAVGEGFFLGSNVSARFSGAAWDPNPSTPAVGRFRLFFNEAFTHFANPRLTFTVTSVEATGDVATVRLSSRFDALRTDVTPAENITFNTSDYMLFEYQGGGWRLVRWDEQLPTS